MHRNVTASRNKTAEKRVSSKGRAPTAPTKSLFHEVHGVPVNPGQCVAFSMRLPAVQGSPSPAPPLPAWALKQNPSIPGTAMFTTSIFLGWPQPSQSIVGLPNKSECFLQHEPGLKAERLWSQLLAQQFMEAVRQRLSSPFSPIPILPKKHNPPLIAMPVQCCYCTRGTKWPHLKKKNILIKMQYHANSFVQVGPRFKKEQHSLLSCLLRLQHSTKKLPGKREVLQLQHAWVWQTFSCFKDQTRKKYF